MAPSRRSELLYSSDGGTAFFETDESLLASDTDTYQDIYQRTAGVTTQVSLGTINGNGEFDAEFTGASRDGTRVFFETRELLGNGDTDGNPRTTSTSDLPGSPTRVSKGTINGNGALNANFVGSSDDGTHVIFITDESLLAGDTDSSQDIYDRQPQASPTELSTGVINGNGANSAQRPGLVGRRSPGVLRHRRTAPRAAPPTHPGTLHPQHGRVDVPGLVGCDQRQPRERCPSGRQAPGSVPMCSSGPRAVHSLVLYWFV